MPDFVCAAVVLAAGASTRLGQPKQLLLVEGESLLRRTARMAAEAGCGPVYVVLGFDAERMEPELKGLAVERVVNEQWREGMGWSLRAGMEAVRGAGREPDSVMVLVCDQPGLAAGHLQELLKRHYALGNQGITASVYGGKAGVPAVFGSQHFAALGASAGDRGARELLRGNAAKVEGVLWEVGAVDVDSPEDLTSRPFTIEERF